MKSITQQIIDRYNEGQDKYEYIFNAGVLLEIKNFETGEGINLGKISLCDFLTNPEYGFCKAIFKTHLISVEQEGCGCIGMAYADKWHKSKMVISKDWIKYIEENS
jgi:hypothetical protein